MGRHADCFGEGMDAVMFEVKGAHLAVQRVGRGLLRRFGLTPARFDLMNALGQKGMKQNDLWRRLNVVRSVVSEMVQALRRLAWVKRVRAADGRTWLVQLTQRGREVFERAYAEWVETGIVAQHMDEALVEGHLEQDAEQKRLELIYPCEALQERFRVRPPFRGQDLYGWYPEEYCYWLTDAEDRNDSELPFVDRLSEAQIAEKDLLLAP